MSALIFFILIVALVAGIFAYAWWWNQHGGGKAAREQQEADAVKRGTRLKMNGWRYDPTHDGDIRYTISGTTPAGLAWKLVYDSDHSSSSSSPKLIFKVAGLKPATIQWQIMDRWSYDLTKKGLAGKVLGGLARLGGAMSAKLEERRQFHYASDERPVGSATLRSRYVLIAKDARYDALISPEVERMVLNWPPYQGSMTKPDNCLSAGLEEEGMQVMLHADGPSVEVIEQVVRLGMALADGSQAARFVR
jgi:hypothetical protein